MEKVLAITEVININCLNPTAIGLQENYRILLCDFHETNKIVPVQVHDSMSSYTNCTLNKLIRVKNELVNKLE